MIAVYDNLVPKEVFSALSKYVFSAQFKYGWKSTGGDAGSYWNSQFGGDASYNDVLLASTHPLIYDYWNLIKAAIGKNLFIQRAYSNLMTYGQPGSLHRDSDRDSKNDITVLCYMNEFWDANWGGETCFFDENRDTIKAVLPKKNRIVVFPSGVLHCARGITHSCTFPRVILVFKTVQVE